MLEGLETLEELEPLENLELQEKLAQKQQAGLCGTYP